MAKTGRNIGRKMPSGKSRFERVNVKKRQAKQTAAKRGSLEVAAGLDAYMSGRDKVDSKTGPYARQFRDVERAEKYLSSFNKPSRGRNKSRSGVRIQNGSYSTFE